MPLSSVLDVLIIGSGPAGLGAALALGRVFRSAAVFDSKYFRNSASSHAHTVPTRDHEDPAQIRQLMRQEVMGRYKTITFTDSSAVSVEELDGCFQVVDNGGRKWNGRKVVLATGVIDVLPEIDGFRQAWGKQILHCLYCRGFEESQPTSATSKIGFLLPRDISASDISNTLFYGQLAYQFTGDMTILLNGNTNTATTTALAPALSRGMKPIGKEIREILTTSSSSTATVVFMDGTSESFSWLFYKPAVILAGEFYKALDLKITSQGEIEVSQWQETSKHGIFAAGDCANMFKQIAVASADGIKAGMGANKQILEEDRIKYL
ncbi:hypothetical protein GT037_000441 [Alternaria burnsii]|uniref:FAD/NAD(P)-binding domain-containing protein n=1 Tax=Alternaria burnsii TaxID=1187904 RepID=A0A8H7BCA9_9PLEO|nr:uncharacterized protein GT037_000441 [Alternaria burnsii]KAF7681465.1 hypothetical protein GT037_000441 [Alternaria burnsii]